MSTTNTMRPTDVERLLKIWALTDSPNAGEAAAARGKAAALLARCGRTVADIPDLLSAKAKAAPEPEPGGFTFYDINNPDHMAARAENDRKNRSARARKEAPEREAVISRYGSIDAAIALCAREVLVREAVNARRVPCDPPHQRWTKSLESGRYSDLPPHLRKALSDAYPLPSTIAEAGAEYDYWEQRDHDLGLVLEDTTNTQLDLCADGRREIVRGLLETGLRARSLHDVLIRQRYVVNLEYSAPEIGRAVLEDLQHLAKLSGPARQQPVQSGHARTTATDRRAEVIRLLSNADTARLSDREIARLVGVSPQTVGNIRRKNEASMAA
jgi:hypothetical protein